MKKLWYTAPASNWNEALPLGNGRLGAMIFGGINTEIVQLNEDSIWSGYHRDRNNKDAKNAIEKIRSSIDRGDIEKAQKLAYTSLTGTPPNQSVYQTAGELQLDFYTAYAQGVKSPLGNHEDLLTSPLEAHHHYTRELNIQTAIATTQFTINEICYTREYFISYPDNIIVIRITADTPNSIFFRARLDRGIWAEKIWNVNESTIALEDTRGIPFCVMACAQIISKHPNASVATNGGCITVEYADEAIMLVDIQTAFRTGNTKESWVSACAKRLHSYTNFSINNARKKHIQDYTNLFERLDFKLVPAEHFNTEDYTSLPTDKRLQSFLTDKNDFGIIELYYHFCRYLLISSSREGTNPATLQGIWNYYMDPPWGSKYTININTQMNYWPACMTALCECELPLFDLLERAYSNGKKTARIMYGCNGYVAHHNLDIWGDSAPQDIWIPGTYWLLGAAWLATHIREHYEYTLDIDFLERYYYLMHDACVFFSEFLVPKTNAPDTKEYLVLSPSVSPENSYRLPNGQSGAFCAGCEMDNRILEHLFSATIQSAKELRAASVTTISFSDLEHFEYIKSRIPPTKITQEGLIQEWNEDVEEVELGHRHISHLYGLFPGNSFSPFTNAVLAEAAKKTLEKRLLHGGGHTGWSRAWIINFRASLCQGNEALEDIHNLIDQSTLPNLFDNHPPFQIDGNFGALTGITRLIVQSKVSHTSICPLNACIDLYLLSALPRTWKNGILKGVNIKGSLQAEIQWENGELKRCIISRNNNKTYEIAISIFYKGSSLHRTIQTVPLIIEKKDFC